MLRTRKAGVPCPTFSRNWSRTPWDILTLTISWMWCQITSIFTTKNMTNSTKRKGRSAKNNSSLFSPNSLRPTKATHDLREETRTTWSRNSRVWKKSRKLRTKSALLSLMKETSVGSKPVRKTFLISSGSSTESHTRETSQPKSSSNTGTWYIELSKKLRFSCSSSNCRAPRKTARKSGTRPMASSSTWWDCSKTSWASPASTTTSNTDTRMFTFNSSRGSV